MREDAAAAYSVGRRSKHANAPSVSPTSMRSTRAAAAVAHPAGNAQALRLLHEVVAKAHTLHPAEDFEMPDHICPCRVTCMTI